MKTNSPLVTLTPHNVGDRVSVILEQSSGYGKLYFKGTVKSVDELTATVEITEQTLFDHKNHRTYPAPFDQDEIMVRKVYHSGHGLRRNGEYRSGKFYAFDGAL